MSASERCPGGLALGDKYLVCGKPSGHLGCSPCRGIFATTADTGQRVFVELQWGTAERLPWVAGALGVETSETANKPAPVQCWNRG